MKQPPLINGQTFAQASAGITDRTQLGNLAQQYQQVSVPADDLKSNGGVKVSPTPPATGAEGMSAGIEENVKSNQDQYTKNLEEQAKVKEQTMKSSSMDYVSALLGQQGETEQKTNAYADTVDPVQKELVDINNQINAEIQANRRKIESLKKNPNGLFGGALQDEVDRVNNESLAKQADLSVIQMAIQGRYDSAKEIADRAVAVRLEKQKNEMEARKVVYDENKALFTTAEQRAFEAAQSDRERALDEEKSYLDDVYNLAIEASKNGASQSAVTRILNSKDRAEAFTNALNYMRPPAGPAGAPTVKTINGVDMQWNSATQTWDAITAAGSADLQQKSLDQLTFLRTTAAQATALAGASGVSGVRRVAGDFFVGDTKYRQLEAYTNTLKVNVMSLMTDPTVKKFFGPQMSNADVELMTSAGTTLNPKSNSGKQMKTEIQRLDDLFNRMQTAIQTGSSGSRVITAPNGQQYEIID